MIYFKPMTEAYEWNWITERALCSRSRDTQGIMAYDSVGKLQAGVVFDGINLASCNVHVAIDNPLVIRRGFLNHGFEYLFKVLGLERVFCAIKATNEKSLNFAKKLGFEQEAILKNRFPDNVDYIVFRMEKEACRWIEQEKEAA